MEIQATVNVTLAAGMSVQPNTHNGVAYVLAGIKVLISNVQVYHGGAGNIGGGIVITATSKVMKRAEIII
jgi:hypothetical protein